DSRGSPPARSTRRPCTNRSRSRSATIRRRRAPLLRTTGERPMTMPSFIWGSPHWMARALLLLGLATVAVIWSYVRADSKRSVRMCAAGLKTLGIAALVVALIEPLLAGTRPRQGANTFAIVADNSQSLQIRDGNSAQSRGDWVRDLIEPESPWKTRLGQDFDVRSYTFDANLRAVDGFGALKFDGVGTALVTSLQALR